jgi:hypothetical protein
MIGIKKTKNTNFLGQKSNIAHSTIGNKIKNGDMQSNASHANMQSNEVYENKNMEINHPTGLKHNKSVYQKSYLEKK